MTDTTPPVGTPLSNVDATASAVDQTVEKIVAATEAVAVPAEEAAIIAAAPAMATPVWMQVWEATLKWINDFIFNNIGNFLGKYAGYTVIPIQAYVSLLNANSALAALRAAQASGDKNALTTAQANADAAINSNVQFRGVVKS